MNVTKDQYEDLVAEHKDAVYRQMIRVCGNNDDAEDVLVEALLRAYKAMEQLDDKEHFRAWLATIGRRVCSRLRKKEALAPIVALSELPEIAVPPAEPNFEFEELKARVRAALEDMPEDLRSVYVMRELEERSGEETAETLGISLAAMKSRLHRARQFVRSTLEQCIDCGS